MNNNLFALIEKIASRNGSAASYSLEENVDESSGQTYLTCDNSFVFAEATDEWLFSDVSDDKARTLLIAFMDKDNHCDFEVLRHLSRLMATKGSLVCREMDVVIASTDWASYAGPSMQLSYLAVKPDGAEWIIKLLDIVPNDARDGIFTACWYCDDFRIQEKLLNKFEEWIKDQTWGDGENGWLAHFLGKWFSKRTFPYEELKDLVTWHFRHQHRFL